MTFRKFQELFLTLNIALLPSISGKFIGLLIDFINPTSITIKSMVYMLQMKYFTGFIK